MLIKLVCTTLLFLAGSLSAQAFQVAITELLPDPEPPVGLPAEEFIELTNVSGKNMLISGWSLSNGRTTSVIPDSTFLAENEIIILCSSSSTSLFTGFGRTIGLTRFPALSNEMDTIILRDNVGKIIHAVAYSSTWYNPEWPPSGRSLEMIDLKKSCTLQNNWAASKSATGGTPGRPNDPAAEPNDEQQFTLLYTYTNHESEIVLVFDDAIDTAANLTEKDLATFPAIKINNCQIQGSLKNELACTVLKPLEPNQVFEIEADGIRSCLSHPPGGTRRVRMGLPGNDNRKLLISEILFDPPGAGADYIELYNASENIIDLQTTRIANRNSAGEVAAKKSLSTIPRYIFPGEWLAFTAMPEWLGRQFHVRDPAKIVRVASLPSWPNDRGTAILLDDKDSVLDELQYDVGWHFELLGNKEGVALERKDYTSTTQSAANWFSASSNASYGTPGYANSQANSTNGKGREIWPEPTLFTPNQDGIDDQCYFQYRFDRPGYVLTTKIFTRHGQLVRTLVNNGLCGTSGSVVWDGKDDKKNQLPPNIYLVVTDLFSLEGFTGRYRHAVTMGY